MTVQDVEQDVCTGTGQKKIKDIVIINEFKR